MQRDSVRALLPRGLLLALGALLLGGLSGCRPATEAEVAPATTVGTAPVQFHGPASPRALGTAVLKALQEKDGEALRSLRVTREEWLHHFWPELPESRNTPFDFAWQMKDDNSRKGERAALSEFGGEELELLDLTFSLAPEVYPGFTVHRGAELRVRRASDGREGILPILSVVVERQGLWKLSNVVD